MGRLSNFIFLDDRARGAPHCLRVRYESARTQSARGAEADRADQRAIVGWALRPVARRRHGDAPPFPGAVRWHGSLGAPVRGAAVERARRLRALLPGLP